jgi:predicted ArsR family transcriptional regulator
LDGVGTNFEVNWIMRIPLPPDLSPLSARLLKLLAERETLSVGEAAEELKANRNTLKDKFGELVELGYAERRGKGRGAHYRPVKK